MTTSARPPMLATSANNDSASAPATSLTGTAGSPAAGGCAATNAGVTWTNPKYSPDDGGHLARGETYAHNPQRDRRQPLRGSSRHPAPSNSGCPSAWYRGPARGDPAVALESTTSSAAAGSARRPSTIRISLSSSPKRPDRSPTTSTRPGPPIARIARLRLQRAPSVCGNEGAEPFDDRHVSNRRAAGRRRRHSLGPVPRTACPQADSNCGSQSRMTTTSKARCRSTKRSCALAVRRAPASPAITPPAVTPTSKANPNHTAEHVLKQAAKRQPGRRDEPSGDEEHEVHQCTIRRPEQGCQPTAPRKASTTTSMSSF